MPIAAHRTPAHAGRRTTTSRTIAAAVDWQQLDLGRIGAQAGTVLLNGALLLALMIPLAKPALRDDRPADVIDFFLIDPPKPKVVEIEPKRDPEPKRVAVVEQPRRVAPIEVPPIVVDVPQPGDTFVPDTIPTVDTGVTDIGPAQPPSTGSVLHYLDAPPPPYPREALRDGVTGTVMLQVRVDADGRPIEVTVARSSGHRLLDQAARRQVLARWRFVAAQHDGRAVQAIGLVPVEFSLQQ